MKRVIEILLKKKLICKKLNHLNNSDYGIRKKISIYEGVTIKGYYIIIFYIEKKSRVLQKEILDYEELLEKLKQEMDRNFKIKMVIVNAPLCSKAKNLAKELKWKIIDF